MNIIQSTYTFDQYYLRTADVQCEVEDDGSLIIYNSDNGKRGDKWCKVENRVVVNTENLTSVLCSWTCRHGGGQFWRHYRGGIQVQWKSLDDGERMLVLDEFATLPGWVKAPGKLTRDYLKPRELQRLEMDEQGTIYGYKWLRTDGTGNFFSVSPVSRGVEWIGWELEADKEPSEENRNGIYAMKSPKNPALDDYRKKDRRLVRLALSGTVIEANEGLRAQHAQIIEVLK